MSIGLPSTLIANDTWVSATWNEYLSALDEPAHIKSKSYYSNGRMRLEMQLSVGFDHSKDRGIIALAINLYGILKGIPFTILDNCSFRRGIGRSNERSRQPENRDRYFARGLLYKWVLTTGLKLKIKSPQHRGLRIFYRST